MPSLNLQLDLLLKLQLDLTLNLQFDFGLNLHSDYRLKLRQQTLFFQNSSDPHATPGAYGDEPSTLPLCVQQFSKCTYYPGPRRSKGMADSNASALYVHP